MIQCSTVRCLRWSSFLAQNLLKHRPDYWQVSFSECQLCMNPNPAKSRFDVLQTTDTEFTDHCFSYKGPISVWNSHVPDWTSTWIFSMKVKRLLITAPAAGAQSISPFDIPMKPRTDIIGDRFLPHFGDGNESARWNAVMVVSVIRHSSEETWRVRCDSQFMLHTKEGALSAACSNLY